jgi:hypothetical protein
MGVTEFEYEMLIEQLRITKFNYLYKMWFYDSGKMVFIVNG